MNAARTAVVVVLFVVVCPALAAAEDAEQAFQAQFGAEYKRAKSTPAALDDVALAAKLLAAAKAEGVAPDLLPLLCERAYELGIKHPTGYGTAAEAMELLADRVPAKKAEAWSKVVDTRQKQYAGAKGPDHAAAADALMEALVAAATVRKEAGDQAQADAFTKRAEALAKQAGADASDIQGRVDRLAARARVRYRAAELKARLDANRDDVAAKKELVWLLVVELDDPAQAVEYHDPSWPEPQFKCVPQAALGPAQAPEPTALEVAKWYEQLAGGLAGMGLANEMKPAEPPSPAARAAMLNRARIYYWRYLALHTRENPDRAHAMMRLRTVSEAWRKHCPDIVATTIGPPRCIDLVKWVDLKRDTYVGTWAVQGTTLVSSGGGRDDSLLIPAAPDGSYRLFVKMVPIAMGEYVSIYMPVGAARLQAVLFFERSVYLRSKTGKGLGSETGPLIKGKEYAFDFRITVEGAQAEIRVSVDEKQCIRWTGPTSEFITDEDASTAPCIRLSARAYRVAFTDLKLDVISGKVWLLR